MMETPMDFMDLESSGTKIPIETNFWNLNLGMLGG